VTATTRLFTVAGLFLVTAGYLSHAAQSEITPARESLKTCPVTFSEWNGQHAGDFDEKTLAVLGVDEYLNRVYVNDQRRPVALYIGYYASQRQGATMHSPLNCLPGAGWTPVQFGRVRVNIPSMETAGSSSAPATFITVNRYVIQKGLNRQLVLYWYQAHGRVVASEYWGRIYMVLDAIRTNRTDGALVRIVTPIQDSEWEAERRAVDFVQVLFPHLSRYFPA
jgi:EpsI family protein